MKPRIFYTEDCLPLILKALGYEINEDGYIIDGEKKIHKSDILGFQKGIGIITK